MLSWGLLGLVFMACAANPASRERPQALQVAFEGSGQLEGHYTIPGELRPFGLALRYVSDGEVQRLDTTSWRGSDRAAAETETTWLKGDVVLRQLADRPAISLVGDDKDRCRELILAIAQAASSRSPSRQRQSAHPTFGDVIDRVDFGPPTNLGDVEAASALKLIQYENDASWSAELRRTVAPQESTSISMPSVAEPETARSASPIIESIVAGVWSVAVAASDTRSLVVEFEDFLAVADASLQVRYGQAIVDALRARFPTKPVRFVMFGHHHPHYTGGLRAFLAAGATVRAPAGNARFAQQIAARRFTLAPDRLAREARPVRIEPFEGKTTIEDSTQTLVAIDIGALSNHTAEYVVFYLPRSGILFQGDLGWSITAEGTVRAGRRAPGLRQAIVDHKLEVKSLIQGWPLNSKKAVVSMQEFEAALAAPKP